jgi:hypothetical protein
MTTSTPVNNNATKTIASPKKKKPTEKNPTEKNPTIKKSEQDEAHGNALTEGAKPKVAEKGRKTRGSKIVTKQQMTTTVVTPPIANIILNLKCSMRDLKEYNDKLNQMISNPLEYNSSAPPDVKYYDGEKSFSSFIHNDTKENIISNAQILNKNGEDTSISNAAFLSFPVEEFNHSSQDDMSYRNGLKLNHNLYNNGGNINTKLFKNETDEDSSACRSSYLEDVDDVNVKDMSAKLKQLKIQLYKNTLNSEKKSACFWCTYDFDNSPCYIPKYEMDGTIYGYGSFCRPECAVAYLMKETIDDSTKFDRYHLLNQIYSKVYECKKNIKPAPDPHYLLDKFYGNLNIQEYRRLLKTEHLLLVIDKPLTRILPELHEDTDDAFTKIYGIKATTGNSSGVYKVKRQSEQPNGPSKASIIKSTFGIST